MQLRYLPGVTIFDFVCWCLYGAGREGQDREEETNNIFDIRRPGASFSLHLRQPQLTTMFAATRAQPIANVLRYSFAATLTLPPSPLILKNYTYIAFALYTLLHVNQTLSTLPTLDPFSPYICSPELPDTT